jgi:hypothetical protein
MQLHVELENKLQPEEIEVANRPAKLKSLDQFVRQFFFQDT